MSMPQQLGLDFDKARQAKEKAIAQVGAHANPDWNARACAAVLAVASRRLPFTTDHVWATGLEKPREPRALGAVMRSLAVAGLIRPTGRWVDSAQVSRHNTSVREWSACE